MYSLPEIELHSLLSWHGAAFGRGRGLVNLP